VSYTQIAAQGMVGAKDYEGLRNANAPITERDTLGRRLDALEQSISGLACLMDQLEVTLGPVMMPPFPETDGKPTEARGSVSPAMEMIDNQIGRVDYMSRRLGTFLRRLAV